MELLGTMLLVAGLLIVAAAIAQGMGGRLGKNRDWIRKGGLLGGIAILGILIITPGGLDSAISDLQGEAAPAAPSDQPGLTPVGTCDSTTTPSWALSGVQKDRLGTSVTGDVLHRAVGGTAYTETALGSQITAYSPYAEVEYVVVNQSGGGDETTGGWYTLKGTLTVPCEESPALDDLIIADEATPSSISTAYQNDNGETSTAVVLAALDVKNSFIKFTGQAQSSLGNLQCGENSNELACFYNNSEFDQITISGLTERGCSDLAEAASANSENKTKCWNFPVLTGNADTGWLTVSLDADDTNNPGGSSSTSISCYVFDSNYYQDDTTGQFECGVTDENGNDVGIASTVSSNPIYVNLVYS